MLTSQTAFCGSIRESYQDQVLIDHDLKLVIIADGKGSDGLLAAEKASEAFRSYLHETAPVTSEHEGLLRLQQGLEKATALFSDSPDLSSHAQIAAIWLHRGMLNMISQRPCRILHREQNSQNWAMLDDGAISVPLLAQQSILMTSEGLGNIIDKPEIMQALQQNDSSQDEFLGNIDELANGIYDGDDRTMVLIKTEKSDLKAGIPREIELFEHVNRQFSIPVWAPISLMAGLAVASLALAAKAKRWLSKFSK